MTLTRRAAARAAFGAAAWSVLPAAAVAQAPPPRRWSVAGTANTNSSGPANPYYVLANAQVQALALQALEGPLARADVERGLRASDISVQNLLDTDVLRRLPNGRYGLAFNIVTREDMQRVRRVADPAGASLAAAFIAERQAFDAAFARYDLPHVDRGVLAMALVGCVVLDWDGLDVTAEDHQRVPPVVKPNGDKFLMTMSEVAADVSVRALYWGSHNTATSDEKAVMSTFGDHESPRRLGFPDLTSRVSTADLSTGTRQDVARRLASSLSGRLQEEQDHAGRIMLRLREGPADAATLGGSANTLPLLEALLYVRNIGGAYHAHVPVFTAARDTQMLDDVRTRGKRIMRAWLAANYARIRDELTDLRSIRAGVPYEVVFTQIWHDLFGWANYHLSREGFSYDPYGPNAEWVSFIPFVWEELLNLYAGTRIF